MMPGIKKFTKKLQKKKSLKRRVRGGLSIDKGWMSIYQSSPMMLLRHRNRAEGNGTINGREINSWIPTEERKRLQGRQIIILINLAEPVD